VVLVLAYVAQVRADEAAAREEAIARYGGEQVEVCVAAHDILAGETISSSDVVRGTWLASLLPQDTATSLDQVEGRTASSTILANEPLALARLEGEDALTVPDGLCAVSVPVQDVRAVGGAIGSGARVDVYADTDKGIMLLGRDLLVLETSAGGSQSARSGLSWVALAVNPDSVQELIAASASDELFLVLPGGGVEEVSGDE